MFSLQGTQKGSHLLIAATLGALVWSQHVQCSLYKVPGREVICSLQLLWVPWFGLNMFNVLSTRYPEGKSFAHCSYFGCLCLVSTCSMFSLQGTRKGSHLLIAATLGAFV